MAKNKVVAVIGYKGMVGSTIFRYYKEQGYEVMGWSRSSNTHSYEDINAQADYIFVCVPTPYNWKRETIDLSAMEHCFSMLEPNKEDCKVIIKSTVPPGTTNDLQGKYLKLNLFFNPEFLSEKTAWEDFINPDRQILGFTEISYPYAIDVLNILPNSGYDMIMKATEAEIVKYINNFHGALMVMFANLFYDICEKTGANFDKVKAASQASKWVGSPMGRMYWDVNYGDYRGYGGKCFPKDMHNLINWCRDNEVVADLLEATIKSNIDLLDRQGISEEIAEGRTNRK